MPHATFRLQPGVDQNRTPALNEAAISSSNLIRFIPDKGGLGLVQKLGGWTRFFPTSIAPTVRALWAWEDTNAVSYLAAGCQCGSGQALSVIFNNSREVITPETTLDNPAVAVQTTAGSSSVIINDVGSNMEDYDAVYIRTQISVGGLVLFGMYDVSFVSADSYQITARDLLGFPQAATTTVSSPGAGAVAVFDTAIDSAFVDVTLAGHGVEVGDTFPILVSTTVGGVVLFGNYIVSSVTSSSVFTIIAGNAATSTATASMNGGNAQFLYYNVPGPTPTSTGYGVGGYGAGGYGSGVTPVFSGGTPINATDWTLDNWGEILIACPVGSSIYSWSPTANIPTASVITNAPPVNDGMFVAMPQRQIVAWGSTFTGIGDPLLIRWCDVNNYDSWIAALDNQAGSYRIPKGSRIVSCIQGPQQGLVWTDLALWAMQYAGPPYVYQFNEIGTGCGLIARKAAASMNGVVYWMGQSQFFRLAGGGVEPIACPVWDVIFQDLDTDNLSKIRVAPNSRFGEISWYYPTLSNGGEVSHYVKYNIILNTWDYGALARTAWINESVLGPPIGASTEGFIYQHETSTDADGAAINASFQTGYFVISDADLKMFVDQVWPDMKWGYYEGAQNATVHLTFYVADYPGEPPKVYGPYTMTQATRYLTPRFRGRLVSIKVDSSDVGSFWRLGAIRYRVEQDGKY